MNASLLTPHAQNDLSDSALQEQIGHRIDALMSSLIEPAQLTGDQRRRLIARYTAVLEGNFIYWMTSALLAVRSEAARPILLENLQEEIGDSHPVMLRKFAIAANAFPTDTDALAVHEELTKVRLFLGRMSGVQTILTMAFLEGFIQRFMSYLGSLAVAQGSSELQYTDVHGICDVAHTDGLFRALSLEMAMNPLAPGADVFEGVALLDVLLRRIVEGQSEKLAA